MSNSFSVKTDKDLPSIRSLQLSAGVVRRYSVLSVRRQYVTVSGGREGWTTSKRINIHARTHTHTHARAHTHTHTHTHTNRPKEQWNLKRKNIFSFCWRANRPHSPVWPTFSPHPHSSYVCVNVCSLPLRCYNESIGSRLGSPRPLSFASTSEQAPPHHQPICPSSFALLHSSFSPFFLLF